jgi:spore photoproduct lyase
MFDLIYIEDEIRDHPRTQTILARLPQATQVPCNRYGEVFNRSHQNFRLQKQRPALILAAKHGKHVLPAPSGYGIGGAPNFYFSHILNCPYDCRYCFLQGMYRSAHLVLFVNYEDFQDNIHAAIKEATISSTATTPYFFSGYDGDSMALEGVTDFVTDFLKFFADQPQACFEIRTKSVRLKPLINTTPLANCIVAYSLTPDLVARRYESGAPPVERRIIALATLQQHGWPVGLRFDPLIYHDQYRQSYSELFAKVFAAINPATLHSVSLGQFRLPKSVYKNMHALFPDEPLMAWGLEEKAGMVSYRTELAQQIHSFCSEELHRYIDRDIFFPCPSTTLPVLNL